MDIMQVNNNQFNGYRYVVAMEITGKGHRHSLHRLSWQSTLQQTVRFLPHTGWNGEGEMGKGHKCKPVSALVKFNFAECGRL